MKASVKLFQSHNFESAWEHLIRPWFLPRCITAWKDLPILIGVPHATLANYIKERLLEAGTSCINTIFHTPESLKKVFSSNLSQKKSLATREDLRLLMRLAAGKLPHNDLARATLTNPEEFVPLWDQLNAAGWNGRAFPSAQSKKLAQVFEETLTASGLVTRREQEKFLIQQTKGRKRQWSAALFCGFSSLHWEYFYLLQVALTLVREGCLCFWGTEDSEELSEQVWKTSWEEIYGPIEMLPFCKTSTPTPTFHLEPTVTEEAETIVHQAIHHLAEVDCRHLGIVFPSAKSYPLARIVAEKFTSMGIPHYDGIGHLPGQSLNQRLFDAWAALQLDPRLSHFLSFLHRLREEQKISFQTAKEAESTLLHAFHHTLTEDLAVLTTFVLEQNPPVSTLLKQWPILAKQASLSTFLNETMPYLTLIGWPEEEKSFKERSETLKHSLTEPLSREAFLYWLKEVIRPTERIRSELGQEPFARISLLPAKLACTMEWDCLIITSLNRGLWPAEKRESALLPEAHLCELNRKSLRTGNQGKDHLIITSGKSFLSSPSEKKRRQKRCFFKLLQSARQKLTLTASLSGADPQEPQKPISDLWLQLYRNIHGHLWEDPLPKSPKNPSSISSSPSTQATIHAHRQRRKRGEPFDEYMFCFREPPSGGLNFTCKGWEDAFTRPHFGWFRHILKIESQCTIAHREIRNVTVGIWLHQWLHLQTSSKTFLPKPTTKAWTESVLAQAKTLRDLVTTSYQKAGRSLPEWWLAEWMETRRKAVQLAHKLSLTNWPAVLTEMPLAPGTYAIIDPVLHLPIRGRMDLLFTTEDSTDKPQHAWIIDFKTGSDSSALTLSKLKKAEGLQVALYALGLAPQYASKVSVINAETPLQEQLDLKDIISLTSLWQMVAHVHKSGHLGERGHASHSNWKVIGYYPLATLPVEDEILEEKWLLTHPQWSKLGNR